MKVAIVVSHPIQHFCPMYSELSRANWLTLKVFFASSAGLEPYRDSNFGQEIKWEGLTLDFPHLFVNGKQNPELNGGLDAPGLDAALEAFDPRVVIVYGYRQRLQRRARRWASAHGRITFMISDSETRAARALWRRIVKSIAVPRIYRRIGGFLSVGDANELHYQSYGVPPERCFRSPFPIDRRLYEAEYQESTARRKHARARLGLDEGTIVCTTVGKLVPWKRQVDLARAISQVNVTARRVVALIIGTGPDEERLRAIARESGNDRVIFAGFVQPRELPAYYAATDIYVHAAEREPHSLAVSEAIFMGRPVLISDRCGSYGPTDDVQPGRNGFVFRCGDVNQLSKLISRLAGNPDLLAEMGSVSRQIGVHAQLLANGEGLRAALNASLNQAGVDPR